MVQLLKKQIEDIIKLNKFETNDSNFMAKRGALESSKLDQGQDIWSVIDHFGLFVGVQTLASRLATYELLKETLNVPGNIIEFGVWNGSNLLFMAKVLSLLRIFYKYS